VLDIVPGVQSPFCAIRLLDEYVDFCVRVMGWDMGRGYLFPEGIKTKSCFKRVVAGAVATIFEKKVYNYKI